METRWLLRAGPPIVALGALGLLAGASAGAVDRPWEPPDCRSEAGRAAAVAALPRPVGPNGLRGEAWFRLDPILDATGTLAGQRLEIGVHGGAVRAIELPPESFAAGPFGGLVLVGSDDGRTSVLRAIDAAAGCAGFIARERSVVRRAVIDPAGTSVYEFRVDRITRADEGVWRRPLDGGQAERVLPPLAADRRFGQTFSTELTWSLEGDRLVVQQCGSAACRVRLFDPVAGAVRTIARPDLGEVVGVAAGRVMAYEACRGLPCPILSVDDVGEATVLAPEAGLARVIAGEAGPRLVHEVGPPDRLGLRAVDLAGADAVTIDAPGSSLRLAPDVPRAAAGMRLPDGWVLLAADGRGADDRPILVRLVDGSAVPLREVTR